MYRERIATVIFISILAWLFSNEKSFARFVPIAVQNIKIGNEQFINIRTRQYIRVYDKTRPGCTLRSAPDINALSLKTNPTLRYIFSGNSFGIRCVHYVLNRIIHQKSDVTIVKKPNFGNLSYHDGTLKAFIYEKHPDKNVTDSFIVRICGLMYNENGCLTQIYHYTKI
jgi:hypothetical protein